MFRSLVMYVRFGTFYFKGVWYASEASFANHHSFGSRISITFVTLFQRLQGLFTSPVVLFLVFAEFSSLIVVVQWNP